MNCYSCEDFITEEDSSGFCEACLSQHSEDYRLDYIKYLNSLAMVTEETEKLLRGSSLNG